MMIFTYFQPCFDVSAESIKDSSNLLAAVKDSTSQTMNTLADENLANGIHYTEEDITNYRNEVGHRVRFNHLVIDPSTENIKIISAKAQDTVNAMETIGDQAQREVLKGNNVVAGINADSYDMDYGINRGILIKDGCIINSQPSYSYTAEIQDFFVDKNGKAYIDPHL